MVGWLCVWTVVDTVFVRFEELANEASVDVLKRQDSRYNSKDETDGMSIR